MSIAEWCERIQDAWLSRAISGTTWGYPIVGAIHVLVIALVAGTLLIPHLRVLGFAFRDQQVLDLIHEARWVPRIGLVVVLVTGMLLFVSGAVGYYYSVSFRIKMALLALLVLNTLLAAGQGRRKLHSALALALWAAVIFAARGIAFF